MSTLSNFSTTYDPASSVPLFGAGGSRLPGVYPNDAILLDIYNYTNDYLETMYRHTGGWSRTGGKIYVNVEKSLQDLQYYSGRYNIAARFFRNYLGSGDGDKLVVQEISSDRLEVRLTPVQILTNTNNNLFDYFESGFFQIDKKRVLPNLYVFVDSFTAFKVYDYVQDPFSYPTAPFSIIFKLSTPLPNNVQIDDLVWIAQEVSEPIRDSVTVQPPERQLNVTTIAGPNFDIVSSRLTNQVSDYKDWNDVLSTNTDTSLSVINKLFSGSLVEGIDLNIDFRKYENFVHFGSAEERLRNFQYKLELLEYYDSRIYNLSGSYAVNYPANSDLTGSAEFVANVLDAKRKKQALLGGFDTYEKYLYYESASYVTNSFGEFYPSTWPKATSTKPYINYSTTSSQAITWFNGALDSASLYDLNNINALKKAIPQHIYLNESNDQYVLFIDMIGHYFDLIYAYINQLTSINKRYESLTEGFAKDLVYTIGQSLGLHGENGAILEELWSYFLGTTSGGDLISPTYEISVEDRTKEVWKRIITNLPHLLKTKGTARGIRALINCYGIPSTMLRVREFGGPEPTYISSTQEEYDQFYYGLFVSGTRGVSIPQLSSGNALELRFRLHSSSLNQNITYNLLSGPTTVTVNPGTGAVAAGGVTISNVPLSLLDTDWWTLLINKGGRAYVGANRYGKALIYSSSVATATFNNTTAVVPGASNPKFQGYINEFRLWNTNLDLDVYENHILAPTSFQGPQDDSLAGSTSSFATLVIRHTFGADGKKFDASTTTTTISSHPDTYNNSTSVTYSNFTSDTASYWIPQVETHYLEVIDGGPTRKVGNKIRIEPTFTGTNNQIYNNSSVLESLQDLYPVDSPRVGVYFSPTDEVDEDINEQFGGYNIDDFIGDPADYYESSYRGLDRLKHEYFKKYRKRNDTQGFIRLIQNYDSSLFQLVKQFVPERALLHTGLVVESHALHRNKVGTRQPSYENLYYTASVDRQPITDGDILPLEGTINSNDDALAGEYTYAQGDVETPTVTNTTGDADEFIMSGRSVNAAPFVGTAQTDSEFDPVLDLEGLAETGYYNPSRYRILTWYLSGSTYTQSLATGQDYWDPIQPVVLDNARSSIYTLGVDRFNEAFTPAYLNNPRMWQFTSTTLLKRYGFDTDLVQIMSFQDKNVLRFEQFT